MTKQRAAGPRRPRSRIIVNAGFGGVGVVIAGGLRLRCALGRSGIGAPKREGDGRTPAGRFAVLFGCWRDDRMQRPRTALPMRRVRRQDGWCDAPGDRNYNRSVTLPYAARCEAIMRDDGLYDALLVLDCNFRRRSRGRGSAIFMHCARPDYAPTEGCVALARDDFLRLLRRLRAGDVVAIRADGAG